ncbi:MAG: N-acetyltransferase, partial [Gammaproteobacteria bacterium]|nr:N-acetyltransferase [Gammaproteobacteria bacterium]
MDPFYAQRDYDNTTVNAELDFLESTFKGSYLIRLGTIIYPDVIMGDKFVTGNNAIIRSNTILGDNCLVGTNA